MPSVVILVRELYFALDARANEYGLSARIILGVLFLLSVAVYFVRHYVQRFNLKMKLRQNFNKVRRDTSPQLTLCTMGVV